LDRGGKGYTGELLNLNGANWVVWNRINMGSQINNTSGYVVDSLKNPINSVSMDADASAWAAGGNGLTLYWTGTEWDGQADMGSGANLKSVSMVHRTSNGST
jgi:hypothetical protein